MASGRKSSNRRSKKNTAAAHDEFERKSTSFNFYNINSKMKEVLGFDFGTLTSPYEFAHRCYLPSDPSCLALFRLLFGALMVGDCLYERTFPEAANRWRGDFQFCRFPLFDSLPLLPLEWMIIVHLVMLIGAVGICLGLFYRLSCLMYVLTYWYIFLLDKSVWNNHSYLFGLTATLLLFTDANRFWSIDCWIWPEISNAHIPVLHYALFRFQIVLVYFIAGLKKLDRDWVQGYSMHTLSENWIFDIFRLVLTNDQIDKLVVHWCGLTLDLTAGFLLYLDSTRWLGTAMTTSFHMMNTTMFSIGQFPYVMMCTTLLFYPYNWPRKFFGLSNFAQGSRNCRYDRDQPSTYHFFCSMIGIWFMAWQCFMPYSHWLTKGYNNWKGGLYGYSWDMMVHNTHTLHIKIKYISKSIGKDGYLNPEAFVDNNRWAHSPDMIKQHSVCISRLLEEEYDIPGAEIYMDIWHSVNSRFQQRLVDPNVDLVKANWSAFTHTSYLLPLLNDLEDWREKLKDIAEEASVQAGVDWFIDNPDITFIADFPGMTLENYISEDLETANITLLAGQVVLHDTNTQGNTTLEMNKAFGVGVGTHLVHVTSDVPACYMYMYKNTTMSKLEARLSLFEQEMKDKKLDIGKLEEEADDNQTLRELLDLRKELGRGPLVALSFWEKTFNPWLNFGRQLGRCFASTRMALRSIMTGVNMEELLVEQETQDGSE